MHKKLNKNISDHHSIIEYIYIFDHMTVHKIEVVWGYRFLVPEKKLSEIIGCCDNREDNDDDFNNNLLKKIEEWEKDIGCKINYIICNHEEEEMVRYIDIGIRVGEFNISGASEENEYRVNENQLLLALADMKTKQKIIKTSDIWEYRIGDSPSLYGLPDDCLYCS